MRQLYKAVFIFPYEIVVYLVLLVSRLIKKDDNKHTNNVVYVIVTSVIVFAHKKLTYSSTRSVYTPRERISQTIATIQSIKNALPDAHIILLEAGLEDDKTGEISSAVDTYVYVGNRWWVRWAVDSKFKSLGEVIMLLAGKKYLPSDGEYYYKVSGRYIMNTIFSRIYWEQTAFSFFFVRPDFVSTRLYCVSGHVFRQWWEALVKMIPYLFLDYPIEFLLYKWVPKPLQSHVSVAGVEGYDATNGKVVSE